MNRTFLALLFGAILIGMIGVTTYASLDRSILDVGSELTSDPWFHATLADAYFGFLTFFVWVAYKETSVVKKAIWFVLIMTLGNIAMSIYVLIQIFRADQSAGIESILLRDTSAATRTLA